MTGQGGVTRQVAQALRAAGWSVAYVCVPNTVHLGVVPIPTPAGVGHQRYPDVVASDGRVLRLIEVEVSFARGVAEDIALRFDEMCEALHGPAWEAWRDCVEKTCNVTLPSRFVPACELVLCNRPKASFRREIDELVARGIKVTTAADFTA